MKEMIENEATTHPRSSSSFALGFLVLTLPTGLLLGWVEQDAWR